MSLSLDQQAQVLLWIWEAHRVLLFVLDRRIEPILYLLH